MLGKIKLLIHIFIVPFVIVFFFICYKFPGLRISQYSYEIFFVFILAYLTINRFKVSASFFAGAGILLLVLGLILNYYKKDNAALLLTDNALIVFLYATLLTVLKEFS